MDEPKIVECGSGTAGVSWLSEEPKQRNSKSSLLNLMVNAMVADRRFFEVIELCEMGVFQRSGAWERRGGKRCLSNEGEKKKVGFIESFAVEGSLGLTRWLEDLREGHNWGGLGRNLLTLNQSLRVFLDQSLTFALSLFCFIFRTVDQQPALSD